MWGLLRRYRWYLLAIFLVYAGLSVWLYFFTESPQAVPFEYQFN